MTQAARLLEVLADGEPHTTQELLREVPCIVHSRVAELRKRGYTIEHETTGKGASGSVYRLSRPPSSLNGEALAAVASPLSEPGDARLGPDENGSLNSSGSVATGPVPAARGTDGESSSSAGPETLPLFEETDTERDLRQARAERERMTLNLDKNIGRVDGWKVTEIQMPALERHIAQLEARLAQETTGALDPDLDGSKAEGARGGSL